MYHIVTQKPFASLNYIKLGYLDDSATGEPTVVKPEFRTSGDYKFDVLNTEGQRLSVLITVPEYNYWGYIIGNTTVTKYYRVRNISVRKDIGYIWTDHHITFEMEIPVNKDGAMVWTQPITIKGKPI